MHPSSSPSSSSPENQPFSTSGGHSPVKEEPSSFSQETPRTHLLYSNLPSSGTPLGSLSSPEVASVSHSDSSTGVGSSWVPLSQGDSQPSGANLTGEAQRKRNRSQFETVQNPSVPLKEYSSLRDILGPQNTITSSSNPYSSSGNSSSSYLGFSNNPRNNNNNNNNTLNNNNNKINNYNTSGNQDPLTSLFIPPYVPPSALSSNSALPLYPYNYLPNHPQSSQVLPVFNPGTNFSGDNDNNNSFNINNQYPISSNSNTSVIKTPNVSPSIYGFPGGPLIPLGQTGALSSPATTVTTKTKTTTTSESHFFPSSQIPTPATMPTMPNFSSNPSTSTHTFPSTPIQDTPLSLASTQNTTAISAPNYSMDPYVLNASIPPPLLLSNLRPFFPDVNPPPLQGYHAMFQNPALYQLNPTSGRLMLSNVLEANRLSSSPQIPDSTFYPSPSQPPLNPQSFERKSAKLSFPDESTKFESPKGKRFILVDQPQEIQRKSYQRENRCLLPNPLTIAHREILDGERDLPPILDGSVTVRLVSADGSELPTTKEGVLQSVEGGLLHPLTKKLRAHFSLKILETSEGQHVRLQFIVNYRIPGPKTVEEVIYSKPFSVRSKKKKKDSSHSGQSQIPESDT